MNLRASPQRLALKKERCLLFGRALRTLPNSIPHTLSLLFAEKTASPLWGGCERVEKVDTLLVGNAARTKITDFRTALYPRQYHPSALEKPLIQRFFAYKVFFRRTCRRKNEKCGVTAAKQTFKFIGKLKGFVSDVK